MLPKELGSDQTQQVYDWLNKLDLPKPTSFIHRDFSDASLLAKLIKLYLPNLVELHNYPSAVGATKKLENWHTINNKVLKKLKISLEQSEMQQLSQSKPGVIERLLFKLRQRFDELSNQESEAREQQSEVVQNQPVKAKKEVDYDIYESMKDARQSSPRSPKRTRPCPECREKEQRIADLNEEIGLLEEKIEKLQQLVRLKDGKNRALQQQVESLEDKLKQLGVE